MGSLARRCLAFALLALAAGQPCAGLGRERPAPYVLQTHLDDHYVAYEINAYTNQPNRMVTIYSMLHQQIQDAFNEAGVEIMSPHYNALRDGNEITVPAQYRPEGYRTPGFRVESKPDAKVERT